MPCPCARTRQQVELCGRLRQRLHPASYLPAARGRPGASLRPQLPGFRRALRGLRLPTPAHSCREWVLKRRVKRSPGYVGSSRARRGRSSLSDATRPHLCTRPHTAPANHRPLECGSEYGHIKEWIQGHLQINQNLTASRETGSRLKAQPTHLHSLGTEEKKPHSSGFQYSAIGSPDAADITQFHNASLLFSLLGATALGG